MKELQRFPSIDYAEHPAFRPYARQNADRPAIGRVFAELDDAIDGLRGERAPTGHLGLRRQFESELEPRLRELRGMLCDPSSTNAAAVEAIDDALVRCRRMLFEGVATAIDGRTFAGSGSDGASEGKAVLQELAAQGFAPRTIAPADVEELNGLLGIYRRQLSDRRAAKPTGRCTVSVPLVGALGRTLNRVVHRLGFTWAGGEYLRREMELGGCGFQLSHADEQWWRGCYADSGLPTSRTAYMHNDEDDNTLKVMLYLSKADAASGAFSIIPGSHRWVRSTSVTRMHKCLDKAFRRQLMRVDPQAVQYMKPTNQREFREAFMALPRVLQASSHFGDDILDDTPLSTRLLESEVVLDSQSANCILFVGSAAIHRGGRAIEGERWALQLSLKRKLPLREAIADTPRMVTSYLAHRFFGDSRIERVKNLWTPARSRAGARAEVQ